MVSITDGDDVDDDGGVDNGDDMISVNNFIDNSNCKWILIVLPIYIFMMVL